MKGRLIITSIYFLFSIAKCTPALPLEAAPFISLSMPILDINDPRYDYINQKETFFDFENTIETPSLGIIGSYNNFVFSISSNRLLNEPTERRVKLRSSGLELTNVIETKVDILSLGYRMGVFTPSVIIANAQIDKDLFFNDTILGTEKESEILKGFSLGYFLSKNEFLSFSYIIENKDLYLNQAFILNLTYLIR